MYFQYIKKLYILVPKKILKKLKNFKIRPNISCMPQSHIFLSIVYCKYPISSGYVLRQNHFSKFACLFRMVITRL